MIRLRYIFAAFLLCTLLSTKLVVSAYAQETWDINLKNVDIRVFIEKVSSITQENFIVDPKIKGNVTIVSNTSVDLRGIKELFYSVLRAHEYVAVPTDGVTVILQQASVAKQSASVVDDLSGRLSAELVTHIAGLDYVTLPDVVKTLKQLVSKYGYLESIPSSNAIIITDHADNVKRMVQIIARLDIEEPSAIQVVGLQNALVADVAVLLEKLIPAQMEKSAGKNFSNLRVVADEKSNSFILKGQVEQRMQVFELIAQLDNPTASKGTVQVFRLKNADANKMVGLLENLLNKEEGGSSSEASIQSDSSINAVVVRAKPSVMREIKEIIGKLDIRKPQVLIEAAIVEISCNVASQLGIQVGSNDAGVEAGLAVTSFSNGGISLGSVLAALGAPGSNLVNEGLTVALGNSGDFSVLLQALSQTTGANLLSTPSITTLDNEEARILVGQNVPFITGTFNPDGSGDNPFSTIERQDVGITLRVTPQIHDGKSVRLSVSQEVSSVVQTSVSNASDLVINKRTIDTTILADNLETIVLGGLIQDDVIDTVSKVPLFGDIPILGEAFRSTSKTRVKRNLLVFLRPTIIEKRDELQEISEEKYQGLWELQLGREKRLIDVLSNTNKTTPEFGALFSNQ